MRALFDPENGFHGIARISSSQELTLWQRGTPGADRQTAGDPAAAGPCSYLRRKDTVTFVPWNMLMMSALMFYCHVAIRCARLQAVAAPRDRSSQSLPNDSPWIAGSSLGDSSKPQRRTSPNRSGQLSGRSGWRRLRAGWKVRKATRECLYPQRAEEASEIEGSRNLIEVRTISIC